MRSRGVGSSRIRGLRYSRIRVLGSLDTCGRKHPGTQESGVQVVEDSGVWQPTDVIT